MRTQLTKAQGQWLAALLLAWFKTSPDAMFDIVDKTIHDAVDGLTGEGIDILEGGV